MGLLDKISNFFNGRNLKKLKNSYIKNFKETGKLESIDNIQGFISQKNIPLVCNGKKYGDEYDTIEEIFSDTQEILDAIKQRRKINFMTRLSYLGKSIETFYDKFEYEDICNYLEQFEELKKYVLNFNEKYLHNLQEKKKLDFRDDFDIKLDELKKVSSIVSEIGKEKHFGQLEYPYDYSKLMKQVLKMYFLKVFNETEDYSKKQDIIIRAQQALDEMFTKNEAGKNEPKENFFEFVKNNVPDNSKGFVERINQIKKLHEYGIDVSLDDSFISFIDATDEEKIEQNNEDMENKKRNIEPEMMDAKDFAMVRTTKYLTKNREMEIVDELNSRVLIPNFLTNRLCELEMEEKYGKDWRKLFVQGDEELNDKFDKEVMATSEKYKSVSTIFRSTKHFTLNGLVSSHEYGNFSDNPYIFIEPLEEHIEDDNILSVNEADTYFKISRQNPMKLSERAEVLMSVDEYIKVKDDPKVMEELRRYKKLTLFSGNEKAAVDLKLSSMGYITESVGKWGYDLESSMKKPISNLSDKYNIPISVHFYSEIKKADDEKCIEMDKNTEELFINSIFERFGIDEKYKKKALNKRLKNEELDEIISYCGRENILEFIAEFNENRKKELDKKRDEYYAERYGKKKEEHPQIE